MRYLSGRLVTLLTTCALAACVDRAIDPVADSYVPLPLRMEALRADPTFVRVTRASRQLPMRESPHRLERSVASSSGSTPSEYAPWFTREEFETGFVGGQNGAYAQMITGFIGNILRHSINMSLTYKGTPVPLFPYTQQWSWAIPAHYEESSTMTVGGIATCGHRVFGSGNRKAWTHLWLPAAPNSEVLSIESTQLPLAPAEQVACSPERTEKEEVTGIGGGGGKGTDEVQWYLCRFEVWIDSNGNEVLRQLLFCTPM